MRIASVMPPGNITYVGWLPCIKWCDQYCEGAWRFVSEGVFEFDLDSDYTMFMLKWA